jgi:hypothetical protein
MNERRKLTWGGTSRDEQKVVNIGKKRGKAKMRAYRLKENFLEKTEISIRKCPSLFTWKNIPRLFLFILNIKKGVIPQTCKQLGN